MVWTGKGYLIYIIDTTAKYYTGMSSERRLPERIQEHINRIKSNYLKKFHHNRPKKPVFVERLKHEGYNLATKREKEIKRISKSSRKELIKSDKNDLIECKIVFGKVKHVILRGDKEGEVIISYPGGKIEKRMVGGA